MPPTPNEIAQQLQALIAGLIAGTMTSEEFIIGYAELWSDSTVGGESLPQLGAALSGVLSVWNANQLQIAAWAAGDPAFVSTDPDQPAPGWFPLTNYLGQVRWEPSIPLLRSIMLKGDKGDQGDSIRSGEGAPANGLGFNGDIYVDLETGDFYGPKSAGNWGTPIIRTGILAIYADAIAARDAAVTAKNAAAASATTATGAATTATGARDTAVTAATTATTAAGTATGAATTATGARDTAVTAAGTATGAATTATGARDTALGYRDQAKDYRDQAAAIVGGDFISNAEKGVANGVATLDGAGKVTAAQLPAPLVTSVAGKTGAVNLAKADVGLENVDNTSDLAKPISAATQTALDNLAAGATDAKTIMRLLLAINELKANQFGTPNGISDDFVDADGVDAAGSTGEAYDGAAKTFKSQSTGAETSLQNMTSANSAGSVVTTSSEYGSGYFAWTAFDGVTGTNSSGWFTANVAAPWWLRRQWVGQSKRWTSYTITAIPAPNSNPGLWGPRDWLLQGSNDGTNWTTIDTRTGINTWAPTGGDSKTFVIQDPGNFQYYRHYVTANNGYAQGTGYAELSFSADNPPVALDLRSIAYTALASPAKASLLVIGKAGSAFTLNTHLTAAVSRNGGGNWVAATLVARESLAGGYVVYEALNIDLSGSPAGTSMKWRVQGDNAHVWEITAVAMLWS